MKAVICPTCGRKYTPKDWKVSEDSFDMAMTHPNEIVKTYLDGIKLADKEHFVLLCLDTRLQVICQEIISIGTLNASLVHPREIFKAAIRNNAHAIIVAHNHPSGNPTPSLDDHKITKQLHKAGKLLGIELLDHIIVARKSYYSFKVENIL